MWQRHVLDSAQLLPLAANHDGLWVDVGTGAGFPGMIIALATDRPVALVEPRRMRAQFLQAIEVDAIGSERDEPGCRRFNVLQDETDENTYYFYEVYADEAALEAHRAAPHYTTWRAYADAPGNLERPIEVTRTRTVFPADPAYWR